MEVGLQKVANEGVELQTHRVLDKRPITPARIGRVTSSRNFLEDLSYNQDILRCNEQVENSWTIKNKFRREVIVSGRVIKELIFYKR